MVQADSLNPFVVVVCGPTASGKSSLAVDIAERLDGEVVSADSIAIYKDLYIGTAKPSKEEMRGIKHHLIDFVDASKDFTVSEYSFAARAIIDDILSRGKLPVICGGTGYYIDAVLYSFSYGNCRKNDEIRQKYLDILNEKGAAYLHSLLKEVDERSYELLHENDTVRVIRALEIFDSTGVKKSDIVDEKKPFYNYVAFSFDHPRERLYQRINERVDKMFKSGLKEEVVRLLASGLDKNCQSMRAIGYKEVVEGLEKGYSDSEIAETVKQNTRRYSKRQITYFKRLEGLILLDPDNYSVDEVIKVINDECGRNK